MRLTLRRPAREAVLRCPPGCWACGLEAVRPPATPLTVLLVRSAVERRRRRPAHRVERRGSGSWPLSAWWDETLG